MSLQAYTLLAVLSVECTVSIAILLDVFGFVLEVRIHFTVLHLGHAIFGRGWLAQSRVGIQQYRGLANNPPDSKLNCSVYNGQRMTRPRPQFSSQNSLPQPVQLYTWLTKSSGKRVSRILHLTVNKINFPPLRNKLGLQKECSSDILTPL
ncbi:hypothetical protein HKD37_20G056743 [Glycine soja]